MEKTRQVIAFDDFKIKAMANGCTIGDVITQSRNPESHEVFHSKYFNVLHSVLFFFTYLAVLRKTNKQTAFEFVRSVIWTRTGYQLWGLELILPRFVF